ncbi:DUF6072 family protein [Paraliomyxa miuraensis]|uniref:DUF6072 family protein n=1 Tax=Paraliomyxa miuraensis TaxID=376150 RepID=UPI002251E36F|nr:DUF6072 family protein [Paraliomyxa miuraensis]MCX4246647.1 hypothetical protein [Paraliomyxa miuraensis]
MPETNSSHNAVKLIGEAFIPGASLLLDGKILAGGAHAIVGAWARAAIGPVGLALVVANSYARSTTGKNLLKQFRRSGDEPRGEAEPAGTSPEPK